MNKETMKALKTIGIVLALVVAVVVGVKVVSKICCKEKSCLISCCRNSDGCCNSQVEHEEMED